MGGKDRPAWSASYQFRRVPVGLPPDVGDDLALAPAPPGPAGSSVFFTVAPIIPIRLRNVGMEIQTVGLIDTGADQCVLPWDLAEALDLRASRLVGSVLKSRGIGGSAQFKLARLDLVIESTQAGSLELREVPFAVPLEGQSAGYVLLGRHPLMSQLDIRFRMGFTDDPTLGKLSINEVVKRRPAGRYAKGRSYPRVWSRGWRGPLTAPSRPVGPCAARGRGCRPRRCAAPRPS